MNIRGEKHALFYDIFLGVPIDANDYICCELDEWQSL